MATLLRKSILVATLVLLHLAAAGQQMLVRGTIYERSARFGLAGVSVRSNSGIGTVTDSLGQYSIRLPMSDSISFSYQGKATMKFAVRELAPNHPFDMSLHVDVHVLPTVYVKAPAVHNYSQDSAENRAEYRKVFDYQRDYFANANGGVGLNLDLLLGIRKAKRMEMFQRRLVADEQEKYVDHRFNKALVQKITGLQAPALDTFMLHYRPSFDILQSFENDYDYYTYIRDWGEIFATEWRRQYHQSAYKHL